MCDDKVQNSNLEANTFKTFSFSKVIQMIFLVLFSLVKIIFVGIKIEENKFRAIDACYLMTMCV